MRTISPEQKAAKTARRERFRALVKQVAAMSDEERAQLIARAGAVVTCEGRTLSPVNTSLLLMQMPNASMVGGFRQWLKAGRCVNKGQHGAMIWVPTRMQNAKCKMQNEQEGPAPEEEAQEAEQSRSTHFIIGTVFDISQTTEKPVEHPIQDDSTELAEVNPEIAIDMRFDPTNPSKVPAFVPTVVKPRKRGQQVIPKAPVIEPVVKPIDLNAVVFEPAAVANIICLPAPEVPEERRLAVNSSTRATGPAWRRFSS